MTNNSKHNITRLIEKHADNKELLKSLLEDVDFSQVSSVFIKYEDKDYNEQTDEEGKVTFYTDKKEQSLALNCIYNLPISNYEDFITYDWINFIENKNSNIVSLALGSKKYGFLNKLIDIATEHLLSLEVNSKEYINYNHAYGLNLLGPILDLGKVVSDLNKSEHSIESDYEQYYKLFKNTINHYNQYLPLLYPTRHPEGFIPEHKELTENNWLKNYGKFTFVNSEKMAKEDLHKELVKNSKGYSIYLDLFKQLEKDKEVEFKTVFTLKNAIDVGNIPVISHLSNELKFAHDKINEIINKDLTNVVTNFKIKYNAAKGNFSSNNEYGNHLAFMGKFCRLFTTDKINFVLTNQSFLPSFIVLNSTSLNSLNEKYPQLKTASLVQGLNLQECAYANSSFYNFIEQSGLELINKGDVGKPTSYDLLLIHKAAKYYNSLNIEDNFTNIDSARKNEIEKIVANLYFDMVKFNDEKEKNSVIGVYILENKIAHKNKKTNATKLKI